MHITTKISNDVLTNFVYEIEDISYLSSFTDKNYPAVILNRTIFSNIQNWLNSIDPILMPCFRKIIHKSEVKNTIDTVFKNSSLKDGSKILWLTKDMIKLSEAFSNLMKVNFIRLRLEVVSTNSCRKFHIDAVKGRLICTYRGQGTQYGISTDGGDPQYFQTTPTGYPILLRGSLWSEDISLRILHRSPPIEGTGETRFVFIIDPIFDPENEI